jgi:Flp pilus assembly protein TadB
MTPSELHHRVRLGERHRDGVFVGVARVDDVRRFRRRRGDGHGGPHLRSRRRELKLGRSIWVVTSWFLAALMATVITGVVCVVVYYVGAAGMAACVAANLVVRRIIKRRADAQEQRVREEAAARMMPDEYDDESHG